MWRCIEEPVKVPSVVLHADVSILGWCPCDTRQQSPGIVFKYAAIILDPVENYGRNRKYQFRWIETTSA